MKHISTTVKTGDKVLFNGRTVTIGMWKRGLIDWQTKINETSGYTEQISTRELNKRLKTATILPNN